jgi:hypothetical protein
MYAHGTGARFCFATGDAAAPIGPVQNQRRAQEEVVQHPLPDRQGVMVALIRYQPR